MILIWGGGGKFTKSLQALFVSKDGGTLVPIGVKAAVKVCTLLSYLY